jgi:methyl-accepting chemotaxis protein
MFGLEFSMAKLAHQQWKFRLRQFLDDQEPMSASQAVSHRDCDFGKWLYAEGLAQYGSTMPDINRLEKVHADMHQMVRQVVDMKNAGNKAQAEESYHRVVDLSGQVIELLDRCMTQVR